MILPFPEVTDVSCAKLCRPSLIRIHDRLVEANGKQTRKSDSHAAAPAERRAADPRASDRRRGGGAHDRGQESKQPPSLMGPWRWRPAIVRVAETEGAVGPAFLIASEIARQAEAPGTFAAPGIAIRRLGRRRHRIRYQRNGENSPKDCRLTHRISP
jgi:hypothetical protein